MESVPAPQALLHLRQMDFQGRDKIGYIIQLKIFPLMTTVYSYVLKKL